jgi:hypothetical protein
VLDAQEEGFKFCMDTRRNKTLPLLLYFNTLIAFNVQLSWFMKFAMEFFISYILDSNSIWLNVTRNNNFEITKHQVPLGMNKEIKLDLYEMVNFKNKIGLF